jgi:hypothetical protein
MMVPDDGIMSATSVAGHFRVSVDNMSRDYYPRLSASDLLITELHKIKGTA